MAKGQMTLTKAVKELERVRGDVIATRATLADMETAEKKLTAWIARNLGVNASMPSVGGSNNGGPRKGRQRDGSIRDKIVQYIKDHPGCQAADIAKALGMNKNNVSQAAFNIRKAGLIKTLTAEGKTPGKNERGGYLHAV